MATINNGDWVADLVRAAAPGARYLAMPDSGFFLDVQPGAMCQSPDSYECKCAAGSAASAPDGFNAGDGHAWLGRGQTLAQQMQAMHVYTNGAPDASCAAFYGRWGAWRCFLGQYAGPHLTAPTLILQNQNDDCQSLKNDFFAYATYEGEGNSAELHGASAVTVGRAKCDRGWRQCEPGENNERSHRPRP